MGDIAFAQPLNAGNPPDGPLVVEKGPIALDRVDPRGVLTFDEGIMLVRGTNQANLGGNPGTRLIHGDHVNFRLKTNEPTAKQTTTTAIARTMRETTVISNSHSLIAPMTRVCPAPPIAPKHAPLTRHAPALIRHPPTFATPVRRPVHFVE